MARSDARAARDTVAERGRSAMGQSSGGGVGEAGRRTGRVVWLCERCVEKLVKDRGCATVPRAPRVKDGSWLISLALTMTSGSF